MWRSWNSGENRSSNLACSSERVSWRSAVSCSSRSSRSCLVSKPWCCHTPRFDPHRAVARMQERVVDDSLFDLGPSPVRVRPIGAGQAVDKAFGDIGLVIAPDLVELLAGIANQLTSAADIGEVLGELRQRQLAPCFSFVVIFGPKVGWLSQLHPDRLGAAWPCPALARPPHAVARPASMTICQVTTIPGHLSGSRACDAPPTSAQAHYRDTPRAIESCMISNANPAR